MLAASTFTIIFMGLIAHVQLPGTTMSTAVLPDDHYHVPLLIFKQADVLKGPIDEAWCKPLDVECRVPLAMTHVQISGLSPDATDIAAVRSLLPSLTAVSDCRFLNTSVIRRRPTPDLTAFVDYSGGRLVPETYFPEMGRIPEVTGWDTPRCMACSVELVTPLVDDAVTLTFVERERERQIVLDPDSRIVVSNIFRKPDWAEFFPPFLAYSALFDDVCVLPVPESAGECQQSALCKNELLPYPDNTNSRYP